MEKTLQSNDNTRNDIISRYELDGHKIKSATFYQAVTMKEDHIGSKQAITSLSTDEEISLYRYENDIVIIGKHFKQCYVVGMANVRYYSF